MLPLNYTTAIQNCLKHINTIDVRLIHVFNKNEFLLVDQDDNVYPYLNNARTIIDELTGKNVIEFRHDEMQKELLFDYAINSQSWLGIICSSTQVSVMSRFSES